MHLGYDKNPLKTFGTHLGKEMAFASFSFVGAGDILVHLVAAHQEAESRISFSFGWKLPQDPDL